MNSTRASELLEASYQYVLDNGIGDLSLRPLAKAIGSSAGVLLYVWASKDDLIRSLLARARVDELQLLEEVRGGDLPATAEQMWRWLSAPAHRPVLQLWVEVYGLSLIEPDGPWAGLARATVDDWLLLLAEAQPARVRKSRVGETRRTMVLAVLRGALLDLLATGDSARTTAAVKLALASI